MSYIFLWIIRLTEKKYSLRKSEQSNARTYQARTNWVSKRQTHINVFTLSSLCCRTTVRSGLKKPLIMLNVTDLPAHKFLFLVTEGGACVSGDCEEWGEQTGLPDSRTGYACKPRPHANDRNTTRHSENRCLSVDNVLLHKSLGAVAQTINQGLFLIMKQACLKQYLSNTTTVQD